VLGRDAELIIDARACPVQQVVLEIDDFMGGLAMMVTDERIKEAHQLLTLVARPKLEPSTTKLISVGRDSRIFDGVLRKKRGDLKSAQQALLERIY